ncbi:MAG TPA: DUF2808 domain-containing protein [Nostocaceae cyanobacterium]|nr:DUF2808 domain-containing protein [Nostocaceae cyanobacterium]
MRTKFLLSTVLAFLTSVSGLATKTLAIQLQDGTVYFAQPPRLMKVTTSYNTVGVWGATYYFTINIPENAGEPLQAITINQHEGVDFVYFDLNNSFVVDEQQQKFKLNNITSDRKTKTVSITFEQPITPGKTITIALRPVRNPLVEGVYLFGVTAYPRGEKAHKQFLGFGRLHFYGRRFGSFFLH